MALFNKEFRKAVGDAGLRLWQVAYEAGMKDYELSRLLRLPLTSHDEARLYRALESAKLKAKKEGDD